MKIALIVGIDYYKHGNQLYGCVNDAQNVESVLGRNDGGTANFDCKLMTASSDKDKVDRANLKDSIAKLFSADADIALFYFSGHGHVEDTGGYLLTSDSKRGDEGVSLSEVLILANKSKAKNKIIVLDSCHAGIAGDSPTNEQLTALSDGLTVLTASTKDQYATEKNGSGVFTNLFVDALSGAASNLTGDITPGSIYAHIDQSLGGWEQRPIFKTNVKQFVSLRQVTPPISIEDLRKIAEYFPSSGHQYPLNPSFEPEIKGRDEGMPAPDPEKTRIFAILQKYNRLNLLVPVNAPHMWNAAMESKSCVLTALGEHYRKLVVKNRL